MFFTGKNETSVAQESEAMGFEDKLQTDGEVEERLDWEIQTERQITIDDSTYGPLLPYVLNEDITDIDYNGRDLWLTYSNNRRIKVPPEKVAITKKFAMQFAKNISNHIGEEFNQLNPKLEGETKELRFSIMHPIISHTGVSICIRKTPPRQKITERSALEAGYATREILALLVNCVKAHMNIVICGMPKAGKTELGKFISTYIPDEERVITIEDVLEWRYRDLKPNADCLEWQTLGAYDFEKLTVASLKQNPTWIMIAETRSEEVKELINGFSTGVHGMTTLHTDDVRKVPMRMVNMVNDSMAEARFLNNIYEFVDVGVLVSVRKDEDGNSYRMIEEIGFYSRDNGSNECRLLVADGKVFDDAVPGNSILRKFQRTNVKNIYQNDELDQKLLEQGYELSAEPEYLLPPTYYMDTIGKFEPPKKSNPEEDPQEGFLFHYSTADEKVAEFISKTGGTKLESKEG